MRFSSNPRTLWIALLAVACGAPPPDEAEPLGQQREAVSPPAQAYCDITVQGKGVKSMEDDYLPHVITCENGGANLQALKAQAIAARSVAYYAIATGGSICDGQGCQVYSCGAAPQAKHYQAVKETAGQFLSYANMLTYGFYVAGDSNASAPGCKDYGGTTSKYVTYNEGLTGGAVKQTSLGYIGPPGYGQNRGCMGQWGARCLEQSGYDYKQILQFYYGADIGIIQATGACVGPQNQVPAGWLDEVGCEKIKGWAHDADEPTKSIDVHLYFGGPAGSGATGKPLSANVSRADLCAAIGSCEHGFDLRPPLSLFDGKPHAVHGYAIDSAGGANAELSGSPLTLTCAPSVPSGIRRHVQSPESLAAWRLDLFWSLLPADDATIAAIPEKDPLPASPSLVIADDGSPEVWMVDGKWRRHVPDPATLAAWGFGFADVVTKPAAEVYALDKGPPVRAYPVLVQSTAGKVDLIDDPFDSGPSGSGGSGGGGSAGTGSAPWGSGSATSIGGSSSGSGATQGNPTAKDDVGSCACRAAGRGSRSSPGWLVLLALLAPLARRRRR